MRLFFASSQAFHAQLTALYDLINPTAAAMWNLRWQVRGSLEEREAADNRELHGRFVAGSGIGSANLRRHCVERTWEEQLGEISLLAFFGAIGLYEGWVAALEIGSTDRRQRLQFPSRGIAGRTDAGRVPDANTVTAYTNAVPVAGGLGRDGRNLQLPLVAAGRPVQLSLLHVQALCALLLNIVTTLDAELVAGAGLC